MFWNINGNMSGEKRESLIFWRIILKDCMNVYRDKTFGEIDLFSVYDI